MAVGAYARAESGWFRVTRTPVRLAGLQQPLRALHLADLHSSHAVPTPLLVDAVGAGIAQKPDIIFLTGDYISSFRHFDEQGLRSLFRAMARTAPTFAVMGNHDERRGSSEYLQGVLEGEGVAVLHNRSEIVTVQDQKLELVGLGDLWNLTEFDPRVAFAEVVERGGFPRIVLAHNPDTKDAIEHLDWDLMLSGHTHGGQVVLPFVEPSWAPVRDKRFIEGLHTWSGRQLYITRGVGNHSGLRFACRPEVSVLEFHPDSSNV